MDISGPSWRRDIAVFDFVVGYIHNIRVMARPAMAIAVAVHRPAIPASAGSTRATAHAFAASASAHAFATSAASAAASFVV